MRHSSLFTPAQVAVLDDLRLRDSEERRAGIRNDHSLKALAPEVAQLLTLLVLQAGARTLVEFGTSHGYSTLHLAAAAEATHGRVYSVDSIPEKTALARENLEAAGLAHRVTLATADGADFVESLPDRVDLVLVDYPIPAFLPAFTGLRDRIAPRGLVFADGGPDDYWDSGGGSGLRVILEDDPSFVVSILPMRKHHLIAVRLDGDGQEQGA